MRYLTSSNIHEIFPNEDHFFWLHGWLFWVAWGVFGLVTILSSMYLKEMWRYRIIIHSIAGGLIVSITLAVRGLSIAMFGWGVMPSFHSLIGFLTIVCVFVITIVGIVLRVIQNHLKWNGHIMEILKKMHALSSWFIFIIAQISIVTGFIKYEQNIKRNDYTYAIIHIVFTVGILAAFEFVFQLRKRSYSSVVTLMTSFKNIGKGEKVVDEED